jgi:hypothetical protein
MDRVSDLIGASRAAAAFPLISWKENILKKFGQHTSLAVKHFIVGLYHVVTMNVLTYSSIEGKILLNCGPTFVPVAVGSIPENLNSMVARTIRSAFVLNLS